MKPKRLDRKIIYQSPWVNLYLDKVQFPGGRVIDDYHMLDFEKEAVAMMVFDDQDRVLMVHAYRYPTDSIEWEIPSGGVEPGEDVLETARREVLEESGYDTRNYTLLSTFYPSNGNSNKVFHLARGELVGKVTDDFDINEVRAVEWFTKDAVRQMILDGEFRDGYTLLAMLWWLAGL